MPRRCVAAGCSNTPSDTVSVYVFPKDEKLREKWAKQVQRTRAMWSPTASSALCSEHFTNDCFERKEGLMHEMGLRVHFKKVLKPEAVPTIFTRKAAEASTSSTSTTTVSRSKHQVPLALPRRQSSAVTKLAQKREIAELLSRELDSTAPSEEEETTMEVDEPEQYAVKEMHSHGTQTSVQSGMRRSVRVQVDVREKTPAKKTTGIQTSIPKYHTVTTQTDTYHYCAACNHREEGPQPQQQPEQQSSDEIPTSSPAAPDDDDEYFPSGSGESTSTPSGSMDTSNGSAADEPLLGDSYYLIAWYCLANLLQLVSCSHCQERGVTISRSTRGTMLLVVLTCNACQGETKWASQRYVRDIPAGNLLLSSAILSTGAMAAKVLRVLQHMKVAVISTRTFFRHQETLLLPAIKRVWQNQQTWLLASLQAEQRDLVIGGDGRSDSPGHSAKYGSYTIIELGANVIIDMQLVQSNEVGGATHMEKEGFIRTVHFIEDQGMNIGTIITDRHVQLRKWIRENLPYVDHLFDIWHIAKGIKKKLLALAKDKECDQLTPWIQSIINHLYWSVVSTPFGQQDVIKAKWVSVLNHVVNIHRHDSVHFRRCTHGRLRGREARKRWLQPCSKLMVKLEQILTRPALLKDITQISGREQTSSLEAFHSLLNHFAPKMFSFSYQGQLCRTFLAVMHFNENAGRAQRQTQRGEPMHAMTFPKWKKGGYTVRKIQQNPTFEYVHDVMAEVIELCENPDIELSDTEDPPTLSSAAEHPVKAEAVAKFRTRYAVNPDEDT